MSRPPFRKVWKYQPVLTEMIELKKGDLFRMRKANIEDDVDETQLFLACDDAFGEPTAISSTVAITCKKWGPLPDQ